MLDASEVPVVGFSTTNLFISRAIRWLTRSNFSHAWFEYPDHDMGGRWILEAGAGGVARVPLVHATPGWINIKRFALRDGDLWPALRAAAQLCGDKYGYLQAGGLGVMALLRRMGYRIRNPFADRRKAVCSELVAVGLQALQLPQTAQWDHESMTPDDLYEYCLSKSELFVRVPDGSL
jgi:hypothetical protein